jgi:hypothetical protein
VRSREMMRLAGETAQYHLLCVVKPVPDLQSVGAGLLYRSGIV